ncbi:MAG: histidine phosphatase family protein [Pseudomonadota bacterium]
MSTSKHTLTLMRHAKSSWDDPTLNDHQRPLNARGSRDAPEMGKRLKARGLRPSAVLASSAARTWQTAKHVCNSIGFPVEFIHKEPDLYLAAPTTIIDVILAQDASFRHMLVIGHNPGMSQLANQLGNQIPGDMPTAALLTIEAETDSWSTFFDETHTIVGYDYPKNANGVITRF